MVVKTFHLFSGCLPLPSCHQLIAPGPMSVSPSSLLASTATLASVSNISIETSWRFCGINKSVLMGTQFDDSHFLDTQSDWPKIVCERSIHPGKLTWNLKMEVWKMIFLFKQVIFRFHVSFRGCNKNSSNFHVPTWFPTFYSHHLFPQGWDFFRRWTSEQTMDVKKSKGGSKAEIYKVGPSY